MDVWKSYDGVCKISDHYLSENHTEGEIDNWKIFWNTKMPSKWFTIQTPLGGIQCMFKHWQPESQGTLTESNKQEQKA